MDYYTRRTPCVGCDQQANSLWLKIRRSQTFKNKTSNVDVAVHVVEKPTANVYFSQAPLAISFCEHISSTVQTVLTELERTGVTHVHAVCLFLA